MYEDQALTLLIYYRHHFKLIAQQFHAGLEYTFGIKVLNLPVDWADGPDSAGDHRPGARFDWLVSHLNNRFYEGYNNSRCPFPDGLYHFRVMHYNPQRGNSS